MLMLVPADFLFQNHLFKNIIRVSNGLDTDQDGRSKFLKNQCISVSEDCFYLMQHFILVITVCQRTCSPGSKMKTVNYSKYRHFIF